MNTAKRWIGFSLATLLAIGWLSLRAPTAANAQIQTLRFHHLTTAQGLAHDIVLCVFQDREGFLWIGTQRGLNRYDGYHFTLFRHSRNDPNSLSNDTVQTLFEDSRGWLWIGTASGLDHLDPERHQVIHHPQVYESISSFAEDEQGRLWIGTHGSGLYWYDPHEETFHPFTESSSSGNSLPDENINALSYTPSGMLWVGTENQGLIGIKIQGTALTPINLETSTQPLPFHRVTSIALAPDGSLWVGGGEYHEKQGGVVQFDPVQWQVIQAVQAFNQLHVTSLLFDRENDLWIGSEEGLFRYDPSLHQTERFVHDPLDPYSLSADHVTALFQDRSGTIWIPTFHGGLNQYSPTSNRFPYYSSAFADPQKHTFSTVGAILKDQQGLIWIGFHGQGLAVYDRRREIVTHYHHQSQDSKSLAHDHVTALYQDRNGDLWVGTQAGLDRFDRRRSGFEHFLPNLLDPTPSQAISVKAIAEDRQGFLWIGTEDPGGLVQIDPTRTVARLFSGQDSFSSNFLSTFGVRAIFEDRQGNLWIGSYNGLILLSPQRETFRQFRHDPENPNSLSHDFVWAITQSDDGSLWVGTHAGLNRLEFNCSSAEACDPQFTIYTRDQGLPDDSIVSIQIDEHGKLWLGTMGGGLVVYDPSKNQFRTYTEGDGLQSNAFVIGAASRAADGELFFGGPKGFNAFYPDTLRDNLFSPPIVLTAFRKFDQLQEFDREVNHLEEIRISSQDTFFAFEFAALDYRDPLRNRYAYKLEGFDPDWIECGERRYASYTNLPPGEYVFRVKGSNSDGFWNEEGKSVRLIITPAWWQTVWFRLAVILALSGVIVAYLHSRQRQFEALRRSEARYRTLFENAPVGVCESDFSSSPPMVTQFNPRWLSLFACPPDREPHLDFYLPTETLEFCRAALLNGRPWTGETSGKRCDGQTFPLRLNVAPAAGSDLRRCILVVEDLSAEKNRRSEEEAITEERRRIAREIHDGLAQDLAALRLQVHRWQKLIESDPLRLQVELDRLHTLLGEKIREIRRAIFALRPVALDQLGFWKALDRFLGEFDEQNQLHTLLSVSGDQHALEPSLEPLLFRIIQEAMHNIARHAQAQTVWVEIDLREGIVLRVRDDGIGFDTALLARLESEGHLGLQQMRERVEALGGSLQIASQIGKGTQIEVHLGAFKSGIG